MERGGLPPRFVLAAKQPGRCPIGDTNGTHETVILKWRGTALCGLSWPPFPVRWTLMFDGFGGATWQLLAVWEMTC